MTISLGSMLRGLFIIILATDCLCWVTCDVQSTIVTVRYFLQSRAYALVGCLPCLYGNDNGVARSVHYKYFEPNSVDYGTVFNGVHHW